MTTAKTVSIVTGGAGFIGSHVVEALVAEGGRVIVVDDLSTGDRRNVSDDAQLEVLDITDKRALDTLFESTSPAAVFHLAAQSSVTVSVQSPERDCEVNVLGTLNVLEAATRHRAPVVFASTGGALYGDNAPLPTSEDRIPEPVSPYGASKWAGEAYVSTWRAATAIPHTVLRLGNVYGPRQSPFGEAGVVAIFSHHLWRNESPVLYGFGRPTRDYVHVDDVARAFLAAVGRAGTFNIATGAETDVHTIFDILQRAARTSLTPSEAPLRAGELERSCMDPNRAERELGWRPSVNLSDGLVRTHRALVEEFESGPD